MPHLVELSTYINGEVVQDSSTDEMTWGMHYLVADNAQLIILAPGDVLLSGSLVNSRPIQAAESGKCGPCRRAVRRLLAHTWPG